MITQELKWEEENSVIVLFLERKRERLSTTMNIVVITE